MREDEGVNGVEPAIRKDEGVKGKGMPFVGVAVDLWREIDEGVIGKGMANSLGLDFPAMIRGFEGDERVGEGGYSKVFEVREGVAILDDLGE